MIAVHFNKLFAESVLNAIRTGTPIPAPANGWSQNDMLTLAGILYAGVFSHGPHGHQLAGLPASAMAKLPTERKEAIEETFRADISNGIEFISNMAFALMDGEYDATYANEAKAIVYTEAEAKRILPVKGFKGHKDLI